MNERPQAMIVELIQKILSKTTESGCTEAEASEAFAKAQAMLLKHNLSMDDVRCKDSKDGEEQFADEGVFQTGRWTYEQNLAYHVIKNHCFIEGYFARLMYRSLYKMHEAALHGVANVILSTIGRTFRRRNAPVVKLH